MERYACYQWNRKGFYQCRFSGIQNEIFNSNMSEEEQQKAIRKKLASLNHVNLPNYLYINQHGLHFH